uniref:Uncharacterized protein n=1 Tax=Populus trichocarpa TaxID=3694 RepID=A0A3N7G3B1_POPTR
MTEQEMRGVEPRSANQLLGKHFSSFIPFSKDYGTESRNEKGIQRTQNSKKPKKEGRVLYVRRRWEEDHEESYLFVQMILFKHVNKKTLSPFFSGWRRRLVDLKWVSLTSCYWIGPLLSILLDWSVS